METKSHPFVLPFVRKEQVAKDTFAFYFDRVKRDSGSPENWEFHPGQYIRMMLPHAEVDDRGTMRYFTISSSPLDTKYLRITTKVIQSSFKKKLFSLNAGEEVSFYGPSGIFYLQEKKPSHVLLAGGIGMTPFVSMIEYAAIKNLKEDITLLVAFSDPSEMLFFEHLSLISKQHPNIKVVYTITHPEGTGWKWETGRITKELVSKYIPDVQKPVYYITGPPPMVEATVKLVEEMGVSEEHILQEHFSGY